MLILLKPFHISELFLRIGTMIHDLFEVDCWRVDQSEVYRQSPEDQPFFPLISSNRQVAMNSLATLLIKIHCCLQEDSSLQCSHQLAPQSSLLTNFWSLHWCTSLFSGLKVVASLKSSKHLKSSLTGELYQAFLHQLSCLFTLLLRGLFISERLCLIPQFTKINQATLLKSVFVIAQVMMCFIF